MIETNKNQAIDALRAICALYIVGLWHILDYVPGMSFLCNEYTVKFTVIILGIFVLLSGYLMGNKPIALSTKSIFEFYTRRLLRIYPLYLLALFMFFFLKISDLITLGKAIILVSMFYGPAPATLWFITMILTFYLLTPLFILTKNKKQFMLVALIILFSILLGFYFTNNLDNRLIIYFFPYVIGLYLSKFKIMPSRGSVIFSGFFAFCLFLFENNISEQMLSNTLLASIIPILVFSMARNLNIPKFFHRYISILSCAGYAMYLFHRPIYKIFKYIYFPQGTLFQFVYLFIICLVVIIPISLISQRVYDFLLLKLISKEIK
jgi:peptidoglycan/LPS O-acetylase OafA/YrhL